MMLASDEEINTFCQAHRSWSRAGEALVCVVPTATYADAITLVQEVADVAESAHHHPDIDIRWCEVTVRLTTHSVGGITPLDLSLAEQISMLVQSS